MIEVRRIPRLFGLSVAAMLCACLGNAQVLCSPNLLPTTRHSPDEFGMQDYTVTMVPAVAFTPKSDNFGAGDPVYSTDDDHLARYFYLDQGQLGEFYAPLNIPAGAVIDYIGLDSYDSLGGLTGVALFISQEEGTKGMVAGFSSTAHDSFATDYNEAPLGFPNSGNAHAQLVLKVEATGAGEHFTSLLWVTVWWRRIVSYPPATADFLDVPTNHPFFQFIEALFHSGITAGCGGGNYCPDAPLTRGQMAVFLAKALGLHWPPGPPFVPPAE